MAFRLLAPPSSLSVTQTRHCLPLRGFRIVPKIKRPKSFPRPTRLRTAQCLNTIYLCGPNSHHPFPLSPIYGVLHPVRGRTKALHLTPERVLMKYSVDLRDSSFTSPHLLNITSVNLSQSPGLSPILLKNYLRESFFFPPLEYLVCNYYYPCVSITTK